MGRCDPHSENAVSAGESQKRTGVTERFWVDFGVNCKFEVTRYAVGTQYVFGKKCLRNKEKGALILNSKAGVYFELLPE